MVAASGGGAAYNEPGGNAGGLKGYSTKYSSGGTQTTGYKFGYGQDGVFADSNVDVAGAGSGYFGGEAKSSGISSYYQTSGSGGSSYISGHSGYIAIDEDSTEEEILFKDDSIHYSGYEFTNTTMIDGTGYE